jgi:Ni/Co efflux regulator RcnB
MHTRTTARALVLALLVSGGSSLMAQYHDDHHDGPHGGPPPGYVRHDDWHKGGRISHDDWNRGRAIDYRRYHLNRPPRGYQWRQVDGNYVLAAIATGVIASAIVASSR